MIMVIWRVLSTIKITDYKDIGIVKLQCCTPEKGEPEVSLQCISSMVGWQINHSHRKGVANLRKVFPGQGPKHPLLNPGVRHATLRPPAGENCSARQLSGEKVTREWLVTPTPPATASLAVERIFILIVGFIHALIFIPSLHFLWIQSIQVH